MGEESERLEIVGCGGVDDARTEGEGVNESDHSPTNAVQAFGRRKSLIVSDICPTRPKAKSGLKC